MLTFSEIIKNKKRTDASILDSSSYKVYNSLSGKANEEEKLTSDKPVVNEIYSILDFFGIGRIAFSTDMSDAESVMQYAMNETGVMRRKVILTGKWWKDGAAPLLCSDKDGNPKALIPSSNGGYVYFDDNKEIKVTKSNASKFEISCYCFYRPFGNRKLTMKDFALLLAKSFGVSDVLWLLGISLAAGLVGLIMPEINQFVFNSVVPSGTSKEIAGITVLIAGTVFVQAFCNLAKSLWVMRIGNKMELLAQNAVWARLLSLPVGFFKRYSSGELSGRASSIDQICSILGGQLIPTILGSAFSFIYLFQIRSFSNDLFLPSLVIVLLMLVLQLGSAYLQVSDTAYNNKLESKLSGTVFELLNGLTKIKVAGAEARAFRKWADEYSKLIVMPKKMITVSGAFNNAVSFGGTILLYYIAFGSDMSASDYIAFNTAFSLFTGAVMSIAGISSQIASLKPSMDMLKPIIEEEPENVGHAEQVSKLSGEIEINRVKFRYAENLPYVLNDLELHIKPGEYIGIVGSSGCGKSTLMRVLLGFEKPESGAVYYDSHDITGIDLRSLRRRIGVVLQNGKLFSGDIYSNIVICAPWLTVDEAWEAAEKSGFAEDIRKMPMGMFTMISEGGGGLSGGQQQRLLIARALAASPDIVMFDEATSALDNITQGLVVKTLEEMTCTRLVIAHRLSTIKGCSRIIYLDKGKVVEQGTYDELMKLDGRFAELAKRQIV